MALSKRGASRKVISEGALWKRGGAKFFYFYIVRGRPHVYERLCDMRTARAQISARVGRTLTPAVPHSAAPRTAASLRLCCVSVSRRNAPHLSRTLLPKLLSVLSWPFVNLRSPLSIPTLPPVLVVLRLESLVHQLDPNGAHNPSVIATASQLAPPQSRLLNNLPSISSQHQMSPLQPSAPQPRPNNSPTPKSVNDVLQPHRAPPAPQPRWDNSFSDYMNAKQQKLRDQYRLQASKSHKSSLFKGVTVWINGVTKVPSPQLRRMLLDNGAHIETYCTSLVTHIVASNLATATRLRLQSSAKSKRKPFLVTPEWITHSIDRRTRLPERNYNIPNMSDSRQQTISRMFKHSSAQKVRPAIAKKSRCDTSTTQARSNLT